MMNLPQKLLCKPFMYLETKADGGNLKEYRGQQAQCQCMLLLWGLGTVAVEHFSRPQG